MIEWPKMLYRAGTSYEWDGRMVDYRLVADEAEDKAARAEGWHGPYEFDAPVLAQAAKPATKAARQRKAK